MFREHKDFEVTHLPDRKVKGRSPKGHGFNRGYKSNRTPVRGDAIFTTERAIWLRTDRSQP